MEQHQKVSNYWETALSLERQANALLNKIFGDGVCVVKPVGMSQTQDTWQVNFEIRHTVQTPYVYRFSWVYGIASQDAFMSYIVDSVSLLLLEISKQEIVNRSSQQ